MKTIDYAVFQTVVARYQKQLHLSLRYFKPLEEERTEIWRNHFRMMQKKSSINGYNWGLRPGEEVDLENLMEAAPQLATTEMDGRQIRRSIERGRALAWGRHEPFQVSHLIGQAAARFLNRA